MDADLIAPRELTEDERSQLRQCLKSELISINSSVDDEEDADVLLDYMLDMMEDGENVGHVVDELKFMEMPLCNENVANKLGIVMTKFFNDEIDNNNDNNDNNDDDGGAAEEEDEKSKEETTTKTTTNVVASEPVLVETTPPSFSQASPPHGAESSSIVSSHPSSGTSTDEDEKGVTALVTTKEETESAPKPKRLSIVAARSASFQISSSSHTSHTTIPPSPSSWSTRNNKTNIINNHLKDENNSSSSSSEKEKAPSEPERKEEPTSRRLSLKDRLAAYEGASSSSSSSAKKSQQEQSNTNIGRWKDRTSRNSISSVNENDDCTTHDNDDNHKEGVDDAPPIRLSLKERMAAFQRDASASTDGDAAKEVEEEDEKIVDTSSMSLKDRMSAFQKDKTKSTTMTKKEMTLKDRMSAYQQQQQQSNSVGKSSSSSSSSTSLQDRMAVFGTKATYKSNQSKSPKESSVMQQRMAKFSNSSSPAVTITDKKKKMQHRPPTTRVAGDTGKLQDRMTKYREIAAPTKEEDSFVAKKPTLGGTGAKKKRQSFVVKKKPNGELQARMEKYTTNVSTSEDNDDANAMVTKKVGKLKGRMSSYQANLASPTAVAAVTTTLDDDSEKEQVKHFETLASDNEPVFEEATKGNNGVEIKPSTAQTFTDSAEENEAKVNLQDAIDKPVDEPAPLEDASAKEEVEEETVILPEESNAGDEQADEVVPVKESLQVESGMEEERVIPNNETNDCSDVQVNTVVSVDESSTSDASQKEDTKAKTSVVKLQEGPEKEQVSSAATLSEKSNEEYLQQQKEKKLEEERKNKLGANAGDEQAGEVVPGKESLQVESGMEEERVIPNNETHDFSDVQVNTVVSVNESSSPDASQKEDTEAKTSAVKLQEGPEKEQVSSTATLPEKSNEEYLQQKREKKMEEERKNKLAAEIERTKAALETLKSKMATSQQSLEAYLDVVRSVSVEVEERELDVKKAEANAKSTETKMKKAGSGVGGILNKKGKSKKAKMKEACDTALEVVRDEREKLRRARDRLARATREADVAKEGANALRQEYLKHRYVHLKLGSDLSKLMHDAPSVVASSSSSNNEDDVVNDANLGQTSNGMIVPECLESNKNECTIATTITTTATTTPFPEEFTTYDPAVKESFKPVIDECTSAESWSDGIDATNDLDAFP